MLHRALDLAGSHECGNEPLGSVKGRDFLLSKWLLASQDGLFSVEFVN
jgi:hypothetical protein